MPLCPRSEADALHAPSDFADPGTTIYFSFDTAMHEASIALSVLDTVVKECRQRGFSRIDSIRIRIGTAAGILPDALLFAFDIAKADTIAGEAELQIESVPIGGQCHDCQQRFEATERFLIECPLCHGSAFTIDQGYEMDIVDMEVD